MPEPKQVEISNIIKQKIWIEDDLMGHKHIMIMHDDGKSTPFTFCTLYYNYAFTSNDSIRRMAETIALSIGAEEPIEYKQRQLKYEN